MISETEKLPFSEELAAQEKLLFRETEKRVAYIAEAATLAARELVSLRIDADFLPEEVLPPLAERYFPRPTNDGERIPAYHRAYCEGDARRRRASDRLVFTERFIAESERLLGIRFSPETFYRYGTGGSVISYIRNPFADMAYMRLSTLLPDATVSYGRDWRSLCEEVGGGRVDFALLPVRDGDGGEILTVRRLIERYELYPCALYEVAGEDSSHGVFGLYAREPRRFAAGNIPSDSTLSLCFRFVAEKTEETEEMLFSLSMLGMKLSRLETEPLPYGGEGMRVRVEVSVREGDPVRLLCYLALFVPNAAITGIYRNL